MKCENCFCIYEDNGECILKNIELDILGQCKECIYVRLEKKQLLELKTTQRNLI